MNLMKIPREFTALVLTATFLAAPLAVLADDTNAPAKPGKKPTPDKLTTCPVSGDKLGEMGKPFVFEYKGQEVKLCCKNCKKDFDKEPDKYMKIIRAADKKGAEKNAPNKDAKN